MKPLKKIFTVALGGLTLLAGCNKFEDWNTNPDKTTTPNASMLCSYMIAHVARQNSGYSKTYLTPYFRPKLFIWMEGTNAEQYNSIDRFSNDNLDINLLANLDDMVAAAEAGGVEGVTNSYKGVRHFIRVYKFLDLTLSMGDIPYSEAIQKNNALYYPKYDTQKDVFLGLLDELDAADRYFTDGTSFAGDLVYGGDPAKWRKLVNSYSKLNARYFEDAVCEPVFIFSYSDSQFLLAEAKARGFLSAGNTAKEYYEEGIRANMNFTKDGTKDEFNHGMPITDEWIDAYLQGNAVKFAGTTTDQIEQIGNQRYLSLFLRGVNHAYWSWRRLGIPEIPVNPSTNLYQPSNEYPMRWMYPSNEITYNPDNVQEAIQRQFGSSESNSGLMWILKD